MGTGLSQRRGSDAAPDGRPAEALATVRQASMAWEALFRAQVTVLRALQADDVWSPVSLREYDVLFALTNAPDRRLRLRELNQHVLLSQPSLSRLVDRLVAGGLLAREAAPDDGRGTVVVLTDAGAAVQREVGRRHAASIHRLLAPALDAGELDQLRVLADRLRSAVEPG